MQPCHIKEFRVINSTTLACTVKILAVYISNLSLDVIIDLIEMLPMLGEVVYPGKHIKLINSLCSYMSHPKIFNFGLCLENTK
jgi:hypothetical protein